MYDIVVPDMGESIEEVLIGTWYKKDGEYVTQGDALVSIETAKADVDVTASHSGIVHKILMEGDEAVIGAIIAHIEEREKEDDEDDVVALQFKSHDSAVASGATSIQWKPSPAAQRALGDLHIDERDVGGSGRAGRIIKSDVYEHAIKMDSTIDNAAIRNQNITDSAINSENYTHSSDEKSMPLAHSDTYSFTMPVSGMCGYLQESVVITRVQEFCAVYEKLGIQCSVADMIVYICIQALKDAPLLWEDTAYGSLGVEYFESMHIIPVIHEVYQKDMQSIFSIIKDTISAARHGTIVPEQLNGSGIIIGDGLYSGVHTMYSPLLPGHKARIMLGRIFTDAQESCCDDEHACMRSVSVYENKEKIHICMTYEQSIFYEAVKTLQKICAYIQAPERLLVG